MTSTHFCRDHLRRDTGTPKTRRSETRVWLLWSWSLSVYFQNYKPGVRFTVLRFDSGWVEWSSGDQDDDTGSSGVTQGRGSSTVSTCQGVRVAYRGQIPNPLPETLGTSTGQSPSWFDSPPPSSHFTLRRNPGVVLGGQTALVGRNPTAPEKRVSKKCI